MRTTLKATITAGVVLALYATALGYYQATENTITCTVQGKQPMVGMDGQRQGYRLATDCGDLTVADVPLRNEWDSIELYRDIQLGETYEFTTTGGTVVNAEPAD